MRENSLKYSGAVHTGGVTQVSLSAGAGGDCGSLAFICPPVELILSEAPTQRKTQ